MAKPQVAFFVLHTDLADGMTGGTISTLENIRNLRVYNPLVILNRKGRFADKLDELSIPYVVVGINYNPIQNFRDRNIFARFLALKDILFYNLRIGFVLVRKGVTVLQCEETGALLVCFGAKLTGKRFVVYVRNSFRGESLRAVYKLPIWFADSIIGISKDVSRFLAEKGGRNTRRKVTQIYNGLDLAEINRFKRQHTKQECRARLEIPSGCVGVGIVAYIEERKRQREFLRQVVYEFKQNNGIQFYFIGGVKNETYMKECRNLVSELQLENVIFIGARSNIAEWYRALDVVCLPSEREGVPRALIEAAAFELPTLAFDIPGCREAMIDRKTGFLVRSFEEFSWRLKDLTANATLRGTLGWKGCVYVSEYFDVIQNTAKMEQVYDNLRK